MRARLYGAVDFVTRVRAEIVQDDGVTRGEGWTEDLLEIGEEPFAPPWESPRIHLAWTLL